MAKKSSEKDSYDFLASRKSTFSQQKIAFPGEVNQQSIENYISDNWKAFERDEAGLEFISERNSPGGKHYAFRQSVFDIPIYQTYLKVNLDQNNNIRSTFNNAYDLSHIDMPELQNDINTFNSESVKNKIRSLYPEDVIFHTIEMILLLNEETSQPLPYLSIDYEWASHFAIDRILVDADGNVVYTFDLKVYHEDQIMVEVPATVFLPDPLTTAGVTYGGAYTDQNDAAVAVLDAERDTVMIEVFIDGYNYVLESDHVVLADLEAPDIDPIDSSVPSFYNSRTDDGFEQVNCFYHLNHFKSYLTSIQFESVHTVPLVVDAHGVGGDDNSYFSSNSGPPRLVFGEGCVDDAEDADVIIHENGHHISWSAAPGSNIGFERRAMDEGIGDYWAASYSRDLDEYNWWRVFSWDGHNTCWNGRSADLDLHYPEDINSSIHSSGQIWSTALMNIWDDLGRTVTDRLMMQANFSFSADMQMPDAAALILQADSLLYNGDHSFTIMEHMYEIGLLPLYVFAGDNTQKCPTEVRTIGSDQPQYDNVSYAWTPDLGLTSAIMPEVNTSVEVSTTYTLTVTDNTSMDSVSDDVQVFVYFCEVGIDPSNRDNLSIENSFGFTHNEDPLVVSAKNSGDVIFSLYDLNGKCLQSFPAADGDLFYGSDLSQGMYLIHLKGENSFYSTKIIKH